MLKEREINMIININTHNIDYQLKSMQDYMLDYENKVN